MSDPLPLLVPNRILHPPGMIGIPCGDQGRWTEFTRSLSMLERPTGSWLAFVYGAYIQANRNELVQQMLSTNAQWLLMVDDDHTFDKRLLINLLDRHVDVVGALALARTPPWFVCASKEVDVVTGHSLGISLHELQFEMQEVASVGTGAMLIRREVFEKVEPPWFFTGYDERGVNVGEDVMFCAKAREAGFGVWLDATQRIGHITGVNLSFDERGIVMDLAPGHVIVIPLEQIEEEMPDAVA